MNEPYNISKIIFGDVKNAKNVLMWRKSFIKSQKYLKDIYHNVQAASISILFGEICIVVFHRKKWDGYKADRFFISGELSL